MNGTYARMLDENPERESAYVFLLGAFLFGAIVGTLLCVSLYETGTYSLRLSSCGGILNAIWRVGIWYLLLALFSLRPSGVLMIPLTCALKAFATLFHVTGILQFSENSSLYEVVLLYGADIFCFLTVGLFIAERGLQNASALLDKRPAYEIKNLYVLADGRTALKVSSVLLTVLLAAAYEIYLVPLLLK